MKNVNVKDPLWWVSPQFRDKVIDLDGLFEFPAGSVKVVEQGQEATDDPVLIEHGDFSTLGAMLFMINGHRPGPVKGFYVVVQAKQGEAWCVGQLHADSVTPLRVFADKLYDSEAAARRAAERMRLDIDGGNAVRCVAWRFIDLHGDVFAQGSAATSMIAHIGVVLRQVDDDPGFEVATFRSYAPSFLRWLNAASAHVDRPHPPQ